MFCTNSLNFNEWITLLWNIRNWTNYISFIYAFAQRQTIIFMDLHFIFNIIIMFMLGCIKSYSVYTIFNHWIILNLNDAFYAWYKRDMLSAIVSTFKMHIIPNDTYTNVTYWTCYIASLFRASFNWLYSTSCSVLSFAAVGATSHWEGCDDGFRELLNQCWPFRWATRFSTRWSFSHFIYSCSKRRRTVQTVPGRARKTAPV